MLNRGAMPRKTERSQATPMQNFQSCNLEEVNDCIGLKMLTDLKAVKRTSKKQDASLEMIARLPTIEHLKLDRHWRSTLP